MTRLTLLKQMFDFDTSNFCDESVAKDTSNFYTKKRQATLSDGLPCFRGLKSYSNKFINCFPSLVDGFKGFFKVFEKVFGDSAQVGGVFVIGVGFI